MNDSKPSSRAKEAHWVAIEGYVVNAIGQTGNDNNGFIRFVERLKAFLLISLCPSNQVKDSLIGNKRLQHREVPQTENQFWKFYAT